MLTLAKINYTPKAAAATGGRGEQRARALPGHPSAFITQLSSENEEEPQDASYSLSRMKMTTVTLQKHEGVNIQLV